jgi:hypothetical protein
MGFISTLNKKRFETDFEYKNAVLLNIRHGWIYLNLPDGTSIRDEYILPDKLVIYLNNSWNPIFVDKKAGIHDLSTTK